MRALSIILIAGGLVVGAATAFIAAGLVPQQESSSVDDGAFRSGPQVGSRLPGTFEPELLSTAEAGEKVCLFCKFGNDPVAMVFAPRPSPVLADLIQGLENSATGVKGPAWACVVVTDTSDATRTELKSLVEKRGIKRVVVGVIEAPKLKHYSLHPEAEATVLLYRHQEVGVNRVYRTGEWTDKAVAELMSPIAKHYTGG